MAIFCHGTIIRYFVAKLKGISPKTMWKDLQINPASAIIYNSDTNGFEQRVGGKIMEKRLV